MLRTRPSLASIAACTVAVLGGCNVAPEWYEYHRAAPRQDTPPPANLAPVFTLVFVAPLETVIGDQITLSAAATAVGAGALSFRWEGKGGVIARPTAKETTYTCTVAGKHTLTIHASSPGGTAIMTVPVTCAGKGDH